MGRDPSNPNDTNHEREQETEPVTHAIEPEVAADAKSRQRIIGKELRRWYDDIVNEPVPDDLLRLLEQIDERKES